MPVSVRVLTGPSGGGKTRLGIELVRRAQEQGWRAGFVRAGVESGLLARAVTESGPLLLVVDYAEARTGQILAVVTAIGAQRGRGGNFRLLLLARAVGPWLKTLRRETAPGLLDVLGRMAVEPVAPLPTGARLQQFHRATTAFLPKVSSADPDAVVVPPDLDDDRYDRFLDVHAAALAAVLDTVAAEPTSVADAPLERIKVHEERYWLASAEARGLFSRHRGRIAEPKIGWPGRRSAPESSGNASVLWHDMGERVRGWPGREVSVSARRALSIGVARFEHHEPLDFAPELVREFSDVLAKVNYDVDKHPAESLDGRQLGELVDEVLTAGQSDDLIIVHIVSHGELTDGDATVFALGSEGARHADNSIAHWLTMQQQPGRPTALFLLDLCSAGTVARLPWQTRLEGAPRAWVIAACSPNETAYDGRFSQATIAVLCALAAGELDVDPSLEYVPLHIVARAIRQEVNRLAAEADAYDQQVTASLVDLSADVEPPFFANPAYSPHPRLRLRAAVEPAVLPFLDDLDEGLDARHFLDRATGLGGLAGSAADFVGCFTGRDQELRRISPWLNGHGNGSLYVVTGSPGSGKSALLGVLVCAAHPALRDATEAIWNRVAQAPLPITSLAAVHARQRGLAAIVATIARQLSLPEGMGPAELVTKLRGTHSTVIVVDALDEADDPTRIMSELLLPLTQEGEPGSPVRLLVGVRDYEQFVPLFERAVVVDLDDVDQDVLENDLHVYITGLLRATRAYRPHGAVVGAFAHAAAGALAAPDETERRRWGPFLVAGLYTRHLVASDDVITDATRAAELGACVPLDLPGVLELDLSVQRDQPWLAVVLLALAHARGAGMPVSVLARVVPALRPQEPVPTVAEIRAALTAGKFYIRQSLDDDHSNIYRLFHQGLADTLLGQGGHEDACRLFDALLYSLGPSEYRDWDAAEPYLLRHITEHAREAGCESEVLDDPGLLLNPRYFEVLGDNQFSGVRSPAELALAAVRAGRPELARRAANLRNRPPLTWQPQWSIGTQGESPGSEPGLKGAVTAAAISPSGTSLVTVGPAGLRTWVWPLDEKPVLSSVAPTLVGNLVTMSPTGGDFLVAAGANLEWWREGIWHSAYVDARVVVTSVTFDGFYICVTEKGQFIRIGVKGPEKILEVEGGLGSDWDVAVSGSVSAAVCLLADGQARLIDFGRSGRSSYSLAGRARSVALGSDGASVALGTADGKVGTLRWGETGVANYARVIRGAVTALAFSDDCSLLAAGSDIGEVTVIDMAQNIVWTGRLSKVAITDLAVAAPYGRVVAVDEDGAAYLSAQNESWRLSAGSPPAVRPVDGGPFDSGSENRQFVTTFATTSPTGGNQVFVGYADGQWRMVDPGGRTRRLKSSAVRFDSAIEEIIPTVVGGKAAFLITTENGVWLQSRRSDDSVELDPSSAFVEDVKRGSRPSADLVVGDQLVHITAGRDAVLITGPDGGTQTVGDHRGVRAIHCTYVDSRPVVFSGGSDGQVRVWDLVKRELSDVIEIGRPIWKISTLAGPRLLVGAGGELLQFAYRARGTA